MSRISNVQAPSSVLETDSSEAVAPFNLEDFYNYAAQVPVEDKKAIGENLSKPETESSNDQYETQAEPASDNDKTESNDTLNIQNRDSNGSEPANKSQFSGFGVKLE